MNSVSVEAMKHGMMIWAVTMIWTLILYSVNFSVPIWEYFTLVFLQKVTERTNNKPWMRTGIQILCQRKRDLYLLNMYNTNLKLKRYYKLYLKIFNNVIIQAKRI
jgi:hypothetical protein